MTSALPTSRRTRHQPDPAPLFDLFTPALPVTQPSLERPDLGGRPTEQQAPDASRPRPVLHGTYELLVPGNGERILFAESLEQVATQLAQALASSPAGQRRLASRFEHLLAQAARRGKLAPGGVGQLLQHEAGEGQVVFARVRGSQTRPAPTFAVGETVYARPGTGVPGVLPTRGLRIDDVFLTAHPSADRQVVYVAEGHVLRQRQLTREQPVMPVR